MANFNIAFPLALVALVAVVFTAPALAEKQVAISYCGADPDAGVSSMGGQAVMFTAPKEDWTLSSIAICGQLNPKGSDLFILEIWDTNLRCLYRTTDVASSYFGENLTWSTIDIPDLRVPRNFMICTFAFSDLYVGLTLANESSGRSFVVNRNPNSILPWYFKYPQNSSEWMIGAVGYSISPPPAANLSVKSLGKGLSLSLDAESQSQDGNLASAFFHIVGLNGDAVWSEQRALGESLAKTEVQWTGLASKISNMSRSSTPVYAYNSLNMTTSNAPYGAYVAPSILQIVPGGPEISVSAFFGKEGDMHALVDGFGNFYYMSQDLLKVLQPDLSYTKYMEENLSLREFRSALTFFKYNEADGLLSLSPLGLDRSAIQHFGIKLEQVEAPAGEYHGVVIVTDDEGNAAIKTGRG